MIKKGDWVKLSITITIPSIIALGVAYMQSYLSLLIFLVSSGVLIAFFLICIHLLSEPEKGIALETLRSFINPLIIILDRKAANFSYSLSHEHFQRGGPLKLNYELAHSNIIGKRNLKWIKETVIEFNELLEEMNKNISDYENEKTQDIKVVIIGQLEVAKRLAIRLTDRLKGMQDRIMKKSKLVRKEALKIEKIKKGVGKW
jgi:hypothetical protein